MVVASKIQHFLWKDCLKRLFCILPYFKTGNIINIKNNNGSLKYNWTSLLWCSKPRFSNTKSNFRSRTFLLRIRVCALLHILLIARWFFKISIFCLRQKIALTFSYKTLSHTIPQHEVVCRTYHFFCIYSKRGAFFVCVLPTSILLIKSKRVGSWGWNFQVL